MPFPHEFILSFLTHPYILFLMVYGINIFGCTEKGSLSVGKDADIVIYDPEKDFTVTCANMHSDYDHTIWEGTKFHGYPVQTYSRGRLVYDNGDFVGERGWGKMVKCAKREIKK